MGDIPTVVLANAAAAAVLFAVAAVVCAVARSPAVAHKAWLLVLVKLITPPLIVLPVAWSVAEVKLNPETATSVPEPDVVPLDIEPDGEERLGEAIPDEPGGLTPWEDLPETQTPAGTASVEPASVEPLAPFPWRSVLVAVWLGGAAAYWMLVAVRVAHFSRLLASAARAPAEVADLVRQTSGRLGLRNSPVTLFVEAAVSPMVWAGLGRPRLVLPRPLWASLTNDQRQAVLAHELAHLRRGDHWVRRLELVVLGLYWWFPLAWLAGRRLRDAEEACCDAWVVRALPGRAAAYAEALVETVAFVSRPGWLPLASGGAARADTLKRRLTMILSKNPTRTGRRAVAVGLLAASLVILPLCPGLADDVKPVADPPAAKPDDVRAFKVPQDPQMRIALPADKVAVPAADVVRIKDDLELLEAAGQIKAAQVRAAEVAVKAAKRKVEMTASLRQRGLSSDTEFTSAESELEAAQAQLDVKKAELNEHAVKVKQAKRRLNEALGIRPAAGPNLQDKKKSGDPVDKDSHKGAEPVQRLANELAMTIVAIRELTARQKELYDQSKVLTQQQAALMTQKQKLEAILQDLRKKVPDATGPKRP